MHGRIGRLGLLVIGATALVIAATAVAPASAFAYHEHGTEITEDTAYTLPGGKVRLGLWRFDWGVTDAFEVGTYIWPWLLPMPNVQLKLRVWADDRWAIALRSGLYYVDLDFIPWFDTTSDAQVGIFPFEIWFSMPLAEDWGLTIGAAWTTVFLQGTYDQDEFYGAGAVDNLQFALSGYWRVSRVVALLLTLRWLAFERVRGRAEVTLQLDDYTTAEIVGAASLRQESVRNAAYAMLSTVLSWETFNVRVGVGFGNYNVPSLNLMLVTPSIVGELDAYFVF